MSDKVDKVKHGSEEQPERDPDAKAQDPPKRNVQEIMSRYSRSRRQTAGNPEDPEVEENDGEEEETSTETMEKERIEALTSATKSTLLDYDKQALDAMHGIMSNLGKKKDE
jgi:hypothetical protein